MTTPPTDTDAAATTDADAPDRQITVVVVDDHAIVRTGVRRLLEDHERIKVVADVGTLRDAVEKVEIHRPDVVLLDLTLGDVDVMDEISDLERRSRGGKVLVLSMHDDAEHVQAALAGGAAGYVVKDSVEEELVAAIESVAHGSTYVHPRLGSVLAQAARGPQDPLTDREREVARLVALGHTNQEIAGTIYVSVRTVETHRAHVMAKLSLHTRAELVRWALDNGLME